MESSVSLELFKLWNRERRDDESMPSSMCPFTKDPLSSTPGHIFWPVFCEGTDTKARKLFNMFSLDFKHISSLYDELMVNALLHWGTRLRIPGDDWLWCHMP